MEAKLKDAHNKNKVLEGTVARQREEAEKNGKSGTCSIS